METWQWIFAFFIILMVARMVPRFLRARRIRNLEPNNAATNQEQPLITRTRPESKDMMVLGEINRGVKSFGEIKRKTGFVSHELEHILESLENKGLMRVDKKQGLLGTKIEMHVTDKGFKEYYA